MHVKLRKPLSVELCQYISLVVRRFLPTSMCSTRSCGVFLGASSKYFTRGCEMRLTTVYQAIMQTERGRVFPPVELLKQCPHLQTGTEGWIELRCTEWGTCCFSAEWHPTESSQNVHGSCVPVIEYLPLLLLPLLFASCWHFLLFDRSVGSKYGRCQ